MYAKNYSREFLTAAKEDNVLLVEHYIKQHKYLIYDFDDVPPHLLTPGKPLSFTLGREKRQFRDGQAPARARSGPGSARLLQPGDDLFRVSQQEHKNDQGKGLLFMD